MNRRISRGWGNSIGHRAPESDSYRRYASPQPRCAALVRIELNGFDGAACEDLTVSRVSNVVDRVKRVWFTPAIA